MDTTAGWAINRYDRSGGLTIQPSCLEAGDSCGDYSSGTTRDHLVTPFIVLASAKPHFVFFSIWVKPLADGSLPRVFLQDQNYTYFGEAQKLTERSDHWLLLGNWLEVRTAQQIRLVVQQPVHTASLLDKAQLVEFEDLTHEPVPQQPPQKAR